MLKITLLNNLASEVQSDYLCSSRRKEKKRKENYSVEPGESLVKTRQCRPS